MRVLITSGYYDLDGLEDFHGGASNGSVPTSLVGKLGTLKFSARVYGDVPRDYPPYGNFTPFYDNSFDLKLDDVTLSRHEFSFGGSNYEPDPGQTYHFAKFSGTDQTASLSAYFGDNGGNTYNYYLSYGNGGRTGVGGIDEGSEDAGFDNYALLRLVVLSGGVSAVVPEPSSWAMLIVGFGLIGSNLRRTSELRGSVIKLPRRRLDR
ncbi:PEPxxWA-CTERM sorting domain-containing protein [Polymorphobacter sp. PAMC 29334]|nr:PEPxxWA-CTERM sorting domain-containing protein [Polymorphobacter sp. PAMC 29334]